MSFSAGTILSLKTGIDNFRYTAKSIAAAATTSLRMVINFTPYRICPEYIKKTSLKRGTSLVGVR